MIDLAAIGAIRDRAAWIRPLGDGASADDAPGDGRGAGATSSAATRGAARAPARGPSGTGSGPGAASVIDRRHVTSFRRRADPRPGGPPHARAGRVELATGGRLHADRAGSTSPLAAGGPFRSARILPARHDLPVLWHADRTAPPARPAGGPGLGDCGACWPGSWSSARPRDDSRLPGSGRPAHA